MTDGVDPSRRALLAAIGATGAAALAGCTGDGSGESAPSTSAGAASDAADATTNGASATDTDGTDDPVGAVERASVPVDLADPSGGLDTVAARLAESPVVGLGEHSHGVGEFKLAARRLVERLVADHGYRLVAIEGTLGDFAAVDAYVAGEDVDVEAALAESEFYLWRTPEIRGLLERLREFNDGRPESDRVVVRGYDAQFHDLNAAAVRSYLERVDPDYLARISDDLEPLTEPLYERSDAEYLTDSRKALLRDVRDRLSARREEYVAATSESEWRLARRHVWTLERGLRFQEHHAAHEFAKGKEVRDRAMAENVAWLREWTGADRAAVLGSANHTMRTGGSGDEHGTRMGQHLSDEFGADYYSLGLAFGTGAFAAPTGHDPTEFETFPLDGPVDGTLESTLAAVDHPQLFLDFDAARERAAADAWLSETAKMQVTVPRRAEEGAIALPESPEALLDGVLFVSEVSPASFSVGSS